MKAQDTTNRQVLIHRAQDDRQQSERPGVTQQSTSTNLLHWRESWFVLTPDDRRDEGQTQFYGMDQPTT